MQDNDTIKALQQRIKELEDKIEHLRVSRRVLMNLIEKVEREKNGFVSKLEKENRRLQYNNYKFAKSILNKNLTIMELKSQISD